MGRKDEAPADEGSAVAMEEEVVATEFACTLAGTRADMNGFSGAMERSDATAVAFVEPSSARFRDVASFTHRRFHRLSVRCRHRLAQVRYFRC